MYCAPRDPWSQLFHGTRRSLLCSDPMITGTAMTFRAPPAQCALLENGIS